MGKLAILDVLRPRKDEDVPPVVVIDATDLSRRTADVLRELRMGVIVRVDDRKSRRTVAWLSTEPPEAVRPVLDRMPEPGTVNDQLWTELGVPGK